jgi:hypothetical protein
MKTAHFLLAIVGFALFAWRPVYADPSSTANEQPSSGSTTTVSGDSADAGNNRQPASDLSARASRKAFFDKKQANGHALSIGAPRALSLNGRLLKIVRVRGPSLAIVGGPSNKTKITASVNGTGMNRKW